MQFKYKHRFDKKNQLSIIGLGALDQFELNTGLENPDESQQYILDFLPVNEQWSYTIGAVYRHFRENGFDSWILSRSHLNNVAYKFEENNENLPKTFDFSSEEAENKFRFERLSRQGQYKLTYGIGANLGIYTNNTVRQQFFLGELDTLSYDSELSLLSYSAHAQASRSYFGDRLTLSLGLRMDGTDYDDAMSNPLNQLSPRISGSYALTEKLFANANAGIYYQRPPYTTLGFRNNANVLVNRENNIKYIRSDHFVAGLEYLAADDARLTVEGFYKHYRDYPFSVNDSVSIASKGGDFGTFGDESVVSEGIGRAYGMEVYYRDRDFVGFNVILSYTYVRSEFQDINGQYVPSAWDNKHLLNLTVTRSLKRNWDVGAKWRLVGGAPYTPFDEERSADRLAWDARGTGYLDYSRFNTLRLDPFHQLDIRIDKQYFFDKWSLMFYLDIQNVYNFKADEEPVLYNRNQDGEPVIINPTDPVTEQRYKLRYISTESGTVLPTLGIMVEF